MPDAVFSLRASRRPRHTRAPGELLGPCFKTGRTQHDRPRHGQHNPPESPQLGHAPISRLRQTAPTGVATLTSDPPPNARTARAATVLRGGPRIQQGKESRTIDVHKGISGASPPDACDVSNHSSLRGSAQLPLLPRRFQVPVTLFTKCFSPFPRGTYPLSYALL